MFGRFPGANGAVTATVSLGGQHSTIPLVAEPYYLWHDLGHGLEDARTSIDSGAMDGFSHETFSDVFGDRAAYQQLQPGDIPNLYALAKHYVLADNAFPLTAGPSLPSHMHTVAATDGGVRTNPISATNAWGCDAPTGTTVQRVGAGGSINVVAPCFGYSTLANTLDDAHLSWGYYAAPSTDYGYIWSTLDAFSRIRYSTDWTTGVHDEKTFAQDALAGRLPAFSWVTPRAIDSMHPPAPVCIGENWITRNVNAVMNGPAWSSTLIVVAFDDWGGYYDHVAPPSGAFGIRVPFLVISPYARQGYITHRLYSFESVFRTAEELWSLPALTTLDGTANDLLDGLDLSRAPSAPASLPLRACPPPPTSQGYHDILDGQLNRLLRQRLKVTDTQLTLLRASSTLAQIALARHVDLKSLTNDLKTVAAAWATGEVILQFVKPQDLSRATYSAENAIDAFVAAPAGSLGG